MEKNHIKVEIEKLSNLIFDDVVSYRKWIHKHPELSFQEKKITGWVEMVLN